MTRGLRHILDFMVNMGIIEGNVMKIKDYMEVDLKMYESNWLAKTAGVDIRTAQRWKSEGRIPLVKRYLEGLLGWFLR